MQASRNALTFLPDTINGDIMCLNISIIDDNRVEYNETFSITLTVDNPLDTINGGSTAITEVTILDNDGTNICKTEFCIKLYFSFYAGLIYSVPLLEISEDFSSFPLCVGVDVQGGLERSAGVTFTTRQRMLIFPLLEFKSRKPIFLYYSTLNLCFTAGLAFSNSLFPFNAGSDTIFDSGDDISTFIGTLSSPYVLYGESYQDVYVSSQSTSTCMTLNVHNYVSA